MSFAVVTVRTVSEEGGVKKSGGRKKKKKDVDVVPVYSRREAARDRARREDEEARAAEGLAVPTPRRRTRKAVNYADGESYASGRVLSARYQHLTSKHQDAHESLFAPRM